MLAVTGAVRDDSEALPEVLGTHGAHAGLINVSSHGVAHPMPHPRMLAAILRGGKSPSTVLALEMGSAVVLISGEILCGSNAEFKNPNPLTNSSHLVGA